MVNYSINNLKWLTGLIEALPEGVYERPSAMLSQASIGQHTRHILELYQCLFLGYEDGLIAYDRRKRDRRMETDPIFAAGVILSIIESIEKANRPLQIIYEIEGREMQVQSNYDREVMYNLEHAIHHMALIKVAVLELTDIKVPDAFGVAPTTLQYRTAACAQ